MESSQKQWKTNPTAIAQDIKLGKEKVIFWSILS